VAWIQTVTSSSAQGTPGGVPGSSVSAVPGDQPYVAVIGGGPAGLIAAERMAIAGARVEVFEHKRSVGRKFLLAGRGGLNITHGEPIDDMLVRFGEARTFLEPAIRAFSPADLRCWSAGLGEPTFLGTSDRVFPQSFRATPLLRSWLQRLNEVGVEFRTGHRWTGWTKNGANLFETPDGSLLTDQADATIFALGGASWPRVGSDGGWAEPFRSAGIAVHDLEPANCGVLANSARSLRGNQSRTPSSPVAEQRLAAMGSSPSQELKVDQSMRLVLLFVVNLPIAERPSCELISTQILLFRR
jgi:predicted Rossmann fold flavoprotein